VLQSSESDLFDLPLLALDDTDRPILIRNTAEGKLLERFDTGGRLDPTCGGSGRVNLAGWVSDIALDNAGRIVTAGTRMGTGSRLILGRLGEDCRSDAFGESGLVTTNLTAPLNTMLKVDGAGRIVVVGISVSARSAARFLSDATCGDGNTDPGEECDDGNALSGDGCSTTCETAG
jgi:cysteine-rich repeat protein